MIFATISGADALRKEIRSLFKMACRLVDGADDQKGSGDLAERPGDGKELLIERFHVFFLGSSGSSVP